jgi:prefoldin subunit 5
MGLLETTLDDNEDLIGPRIFKELESTYNILDKRAEELETELEESRDRIKELEDRVTELEADL